MSSGALGYGVYRTESRARILGIAGGCRPRASGGVIKNVLELRALLNWIALALPHSTDRRGPAPAIRGEGTEHSGTEHIAAKRGCVDPRDRWRMSSARSGWSDQ